MLKYPVGLITADEVATAGTGYGSGMANSNFYLNTGAYYWTASPSIFHATYGHAYVWYVNSNGSLTYYNSALSCGVRPVINLSSFVLFDSGTGIETDPYKVKL